MVSLALLSTVVMGLLVVGVFGAVARYGAKRARPGRVLAAEPAEGAEARIARLRALSRNPTVWTVTFILLAVGLGVGAVAAVGDVGLPDGVSGALFGVVAGVVGLLLVGYVFYGAYAAARSRGLGNAHGVAAGLGALGLAFLVVIILQLTVGLLG
jgi:hypothetical protein